MFCCVHLKVVHLLEAIACSVVFYFIWLPRLNSSILNCLSLSVNLITLPYANQSLIVPNMSIFNVNFDVHNA